MFVPFCISVSFNATVYNLSSVHLHLVHSILNPPTSDEMGYIPQNPMTQRHLLAFDNYTSAFTATD